MNTIYQGYGASIEVEAKWLEVLEEEDRIIYNNNRRHRRKSCSLDAYNADDNLLPSEVDVAAEVVSKDQLDRAFVGLTPEQEKAVHRKYLEGYQTQEIAADLGVSNAAVSQQISRALKRMQKNLEEAA
jgi:RNA polymerase sigma factor (sigma-70 family)